jgi:hypothetical protein
MVNETYWLLLNLWLRIKLKYVILKKKPKQKNDLINIDKVWGRANVIIANICIDVGNNYSGANSKHIFAYYTG